RPAFHLMPYNAVPQFPALFVHQRDSNAPGNAQQPLIMVRIADIKPERPGRLKNTPHLQQDIEQPADILPIILLLPDPPSMIGTMFPVRRTGQATIQHSIRKLTEERTRTALQKQRLNVIALEVGL